MTCRTADLIRQTAERVRHGVDLGDALLAVTRDESHDRWVNLVAGIARDLRCTNPINRWDHDRLPGDDGRDHPAAYGMRLQEWAARIGGPHEVAAWLDALANLADLELLAPSMSTLGGRAHIGRHANLTEIGGVR